MNSELIEPLRYILFVDGVDYEAFPEVFTDLLIEEQESFCVDLAILDNQIPNGDKYFYLVLNSTDDFVAFSNINTTIIILDNDDRKGPLLHIL